MPTSSPVPTPEPEITPPSDPFEAEEVTEEETPSPEASPAPEAEHEGGSETDASGTDTAGTEGNTSEQNAGQEQPQAPATPQSAEVDAPDMVLDDYYKESEGSFDAEKWLDEVSKPIEEALKAKTLDEALVNVFFAAPESIMKAFTNLLEQYYEDQKEKAKESKKNRNDLFKDIMKSRRDFGSLAARSFQDWALRGRVYAGAEARGEKLTSEQKAALKRARFIEGLPRTGDGSIAWNQMNSSEKKIYETSLRSYVMKSKEFKKLAARELGLNLNEKELGLLLKSISMTHTTSDAARGVSLQNLEQDNTDVLREMAANHERAMNSRDSRASANERDILNLRNLGRHGGRSGGRGGRESGGRV